MRVGLGHIFAVLLALGGAALGCSLSLSGAAPAPTDSANVGGGGVPPVVHILDPADGAVVPVAQRVDITVQTESAADRFTLTVNGVVVSTKALPPDQSGTTAAILSWTPQYEGTYTLEVAAYRGVVAGPPASLQLQVAGTGDDVGGGVGTDCVGRVLVSQLNFRDGPGTNYTRLGQFQVGETVSVLGTDAARTWLKVQRTLNGQQVWVINKSQWLQLEGPCMNLPVLG